MATEFGTITVNFHDDPDDDAGELAAALEAGHSRVVFLELDLAPDPIRVHSSIADIDYDGKPWIGVGTLGGLSDVDTGSALAAPEIQAQLTLVGDASLRAVIAQGNYSGRAASIHLGAIHTLNGDLITALPIWWGFIDRASIENGATTCTAVVNLTDEMARHDTAPGGTYTHADHVSRHPDDPFFQHVQKIQDMPVNWGPQR